MSVINLLLFFSNYFTIISASNNNNSSLSSINDISIKLQKKEKKIALYKLRVEIKNAKKTIENVQKKR